MKKLLFALMSLMAFSQCSHKTFSIANPSESLIEIGSYGGFAGLSEVYHFFENGQRYFVSSMSGEAELEPMKKRDFNKMCKELLETDIQNIDLAEVGNMNYFIRLKFKDIDKKVQWENPETAPQALVDFMRKHTKDLKPQSIQ